MDLDKFTMEEQANKQPRCTTCNLDSKILEQIHAGRARQPKPVPFPTISKWLEKAHGIKIQHWTLRYHFVAGHDE